MKRSKHSLSHYKLLTCDMGKLVPAGFYEVLPGDSVQQFTSALIRVSPLLAPVMHPVTVRFHHWFVPHRLVWDEWEDFITGGSDGAGDGATYPNTMATATKGDLYDYLGVPVTGAAISVSELPLKSFWLIYNEFYRDQDLVSPVSDGTTTVPNIAWEKDYLTAARPWPQKGPDVSLPLGTRANVKMDTFSGGTVEDGKYVIVGRTAGGAYETHAGATFGAPGTAVANPSSHNLYADLANATATNVNDVRRAFALQRYQEARAMYGSRYSEYLRYLGVRSSDARLDRPEYLGGGRQTISFSEVLKTGSVEDPAEAIGTMKGHGISATRTRRFRRFFEEHGIVMTLLSVRPRTMYVDGLHRSWSRRTKEDYWQMELERIGQQEILDSEVYASGSTGATWAYGDRYAEYRHLPSQVAGDFRDTLNFWHLARDFASAPVLNQSFIECDPSKRIHAEQTSHVLWCMVNNNIQARRPVGNPRIGRIF